MSSWTAAAVYPLWRAWRANRGTALAHAVGWAVAAWAAWLAAFLFGGDGALGRYVALSLTGCAGVAVLGARRPHVGAWNFVVASLLAVLLLPVAQGFRHAATSRAPAAHPTRSASCRRRARAR